MWFLVLYSLPLDDDPVLGQSLGLYKIGKLSLEDYSTTALNIASASSGAQINHLSLSEERYTLTQLRTTYTVRSDTDSVSHT